ncbi:MAG TPA: RDD family protein [Chryseosolibacter sp.]
MQTLSDASYGYSTGHHATAGVGDRILAFIIDGLILGCYAPIIVWTLLDANIDDLWIWFIFLLGPLLFYNLIFEIVMKGQTPGKRMVRIQVVTLENEAASVAQHLIRWFFSIIGFYFVSGVIALIIISVNGKGQSFGDIVAGTKVVKIPRGIAYTFYKPAFPTVITLEQYDIELAKRALYAALELDNPQPLTLVSEQLKKTMNVQTNLSDHDFLATLVKDYQHFSTR